MAAKKPIDKTSDPHYVVLCYHEGDGEPSEVRVAHSYDEAVEASHKWFLSYDFTLKGGKPCDEDGNPDDPFGVFDDVKMSKGKVAQFVHFGGEGPSAFIRKAKTR